jgi:hypothetical protein
VWGNELSRGNSHGNLPVPFVLAGGANGLMQMGRYLNPGQTGTLPVDLSKPGTYEWYCPVGEHRDFGMEGEITVGGGGGQATTGTGTTESSGSGYGK